MQFDPWSFAEQRTLSEVVGANVRRLRQAQGLSQEVLASKLVDYGVTLARPTIAQMEAARRPLSVDELLALGLVLGVAPHVLLYPPAEPGLEVAASNDLDVETIDAPELADWLWKPDENPRSRAGESERARWLESSQLARQMVSPEVQRIRKQVERERLKVKASTARKTKRPRRA